MSHLVLSESSKSSVTCLGMGRFGILALLIKSAGGLASVVGATRCNSGGGDVFAKLFKPSKMIVHLTISMIRESQIEFVTSRAVMTQLKH